jgi:hypothetical protein
LSGEANKMMVTEKFFTKEFTAVTSKDAYLKACRWVANNVVSKITDIGETLWKIEKVVETDEKVIYKLELYCTLETKEEVVKFCENCKSMHKLFYINEEYNCNRCNMKAFVERTKTKLEVKEQYRKERLNYLLNKGE